MNLPPVVSADEWQAAHEQLLAKEKEATLGGLARRLPADAALHVVAPAGRVRRRDVELDPRAGEAVASLRQIRWAFGFAGSGVLTSGFGRSLAVSGIGRSISGHARASARTSLTERRRSRTYPAWGCHASPVLKTGWATGPGPLRRQR
jgi:hypothetical protein